jgi:hypothetical protein
MNPAFNVYLAQELINDNIRQAERFRRSREVDRGEVDLGSPVTVRPYQARDAHALQRFAEMDGGQVPAEPILVAEIDGKVLAARSVLTRQTLADPSRPTAELVKLLDLRSVHLRHVADGGVPRPHRMRRFARALTAPIRT